MSKQIIAVDIDEVIVETVHHIIAHYNKVHGTQVSLDAYYHPAVERVWQAPDRETAIQRVNAYLETDEYFNLAPSAETKRAIRKLKQRYELVIITGRPEFTEETTRKWLAKHFRDTFSSVVFTNFYSRKGDRRHKGEICVDIGASFLIDDHLDHVLNASKHGIDVVLFGSYPWSDTDSLPERVTRCEDWQAVLEYFDARG